MPRAFLAILLSLAVAGAAVAQDGERGMLSAEQYQYLQILLRQFQADAAADAAYERGDYSTALALWRPLAEQGVAEAQFNLGLMYSNGEGVPQDYAEAVQWFQLAAEQENARGQFGLGYMYEHGYGVPQDYAEAQRWYRLAGEQGLVKAIIPALFLGLVVRFDSPPWLVLAAVSVAGALALALPVLVWRWLVIVLMGRRLHRQRSLWREDYEAAEAMPPGARRAWARWRLYFRRHRDI